MKANIGATYSQPYSFLIQQSYIPSGSSLISHLFPGLLSKSFSPWQTHCISSGFATALTAAGPITFSGSHRQDQVIAISQITHHRGRAEGKPHSGQRCEYDLQLSSLEEHGEHKGQGQQQRWPGTHWTHSQLHAVGGCQDPRGADDNPAALVVSKEVQGSVPWPAVRTGLLSPANALEQLPGSHRGKATAVCKSQRSGYKLSRKFSVFLDNLVEGIHLGQRSRRDQVCLSCLQWVGEGKTDRWKLES